jgi:creatinine amidohydrolase
MSKNEEHFLLEDLTWVEAKEYFSENDVVILPVGSIEQHGPHNPLSTDIQNAYAIAKEAAKRTGVLCLPGIPVGFSREHKEFPGTLWVSHQTFELYVKEVILSATYHGAKKVIVVNGHGHNLVRRKN